MTSSSGRAKAWLPIERILEYRRGRVLFALVLTITPLIVGLISVSLGRYPLSLSEVFNAIAVKLGAPAVVDENTLKVIWTMRIPRVLLALLVGGGLSVAGCAFQSLFANPLATPDTLGVAGGASFGAALGLLFGFDLLMVQVMALVMGFGAVVLTYAVGYKRRGGSLVTVVLAGIIISSLFSALVSLVKYTADTESQLPSITYWLMGSLNGTGYHTLVLGAPFILVGAAILFLLRWRLNVLPLSEDEARSTGTDLRLLRILTALSATMITASAVSMCGQVGWVGLLIPHICRMAIGSNNLRLVPASISVGAVFLVVIDTLARCITASEIPISILTAIIGAPFFIVLLRRTGGWNI